MATSLISLRGGGLFVVSSGRETLVNKRFTFSTKIGKKLGSVCVSSRRLSRLYFYQEVFGSPEIG